MNKKRILSACAFVALLGAALMPTRVAAQNSYEWKVVDCTQSHLLPSATGQVCRATNVVTGDGGGMWQRSSVVGMTSEGYVHYFVWESLNMVAHIRITETLLEFLKWINPNAESGNGFSGMQRYGNSDYMTFRNKKSQPCAGFRRLGDSRRAGYVWVMGGVKCWPKEKDVTQVQIAQFIDQGQLR